MHQLLKLPPPHGHSSSPPLILDPAADLALNNDRPNRVHGLKTTFTVKRAKKTETVCKYLRNYRVKIEVAQSPPPKKAKLAGVAHAFVTNGHPSIND